MANLFSNIALNLRATGPAAALCVWFASIAAVAIFAPAENAARGFNVLTGAGGVLIFVLAQPILQSKKEHPDGGGD